MEWICVFCFLFKLSDFFFDEIGLFILNDSNCEDEDSEVEFFDINEVLVKIKDIRIEYRKEWVIVCFNINSF